MDDSNSSDDMFNPNDNRRNRNGMEECSRIIEDSPGVSYKEGKDDILTPTKSHFQSVTRVPKVAVQEKIVICIENSQENGLGYTFSDLNENSKEPDTYTIRNEAIRMFMVNKHTLAKDTEFAVVSIEPGKLKRLSQFTSNLNQLTKSLREHKQFFKYENDIFDITPIFSDLAKTVDVPESTNVAIVPPNHIVRVILVYNNSFLVPQVNTKDPLYLKFMTSPFFFFDVLYLHEKQSEFNSVTRIHEELGSLLSPSSYLLECSRDITAVFNSAMKLLAHPNQRVIESMQNF